MEAGKIAASKRGARDARDLEALGHASEPPTVLMVEQKDQANPSYKCSRRNLEAALSVIEGKWKALIICELMTNSLRYHELEKLLRHISRRILTYELRFLEEKGIVQRFSAETSTRRIEYSLTARGKELNGVLVELLISA